MANWIEGASVFVNAVVGGIVYWYTRETHKLRVASEAQLSLARRESKFALDPFVSVMLDPNETKEPENLLSYVETTRRILLTQSPYLARGRRYAFSEISVFFKGFQ